MSTEIELPRGHKAWLRDPADMTVGQRRPLQVLVSAFGESRFKYLVSAAQTPGGEKPVTPEEKRAADAATQRVIDELAMTETDWDLLLRTTNATVFGLLENWTLDQPVPKTVAEVDDIPGWALDAIAAESTRLQADHLAKNGMTVDSVEVEDSPTTASAPSIGSSEVAEAAPQSSLSTPELLSTSTDTAASSVV